MAPASFFSAQKVFLLLSFFFPAVPGAVEFFRLTGFFPAEKVSFSTRKVLFGGAPCVLAANAVLHVDHRLFSGAGSIFSSAVDLAAPTPVLSGEIQAPGQDR